jgi:hypothetical protein
MALIKLQFTPGVNRDQTNYSNEGGWYACDKIRFRSGYPEKIGGWQKATTNQFYGVCRQMWNWFTTYGDDFLALGTNNKVYIEAGGYYNDITPLRASVPVLSSPNTNNCISTVDLSTTVTISLGTAHNAVTGSFVTIAGATAVGGIAAADLNANHQITVTSSTAFTIVVPTAATSTVPSSGGTGITISFEIEPGYAIPTYGYGWGTGVWGGYIPATPTVPAPRPWGLGSTTGPIILPQEDWWFDNIDNDLVMNIRNGTPYYWQRGGSTDPTGSLSTRAITLAAYATSAGYTATSVPSKVMQILVSQQDKHVIAFGAVPYGLTSVSDFDPLLIRWSDQDNPGQWTPTATNSAGFQRVSRGSRIIRALPTRQEILVFTDTHLFTLQFLGTTDVFGLQEYADNVSIIAPRAAISAANITYWMGQDKFYAYTGRVETLPCTLRNHVFNNINIEQSAQIVCGTNEQWNEIWWFYPTADSNWNNAYVVYNHLEKIWYYGTIERSAWLDTPLRHFPQSANTSSAAVDVPSTQGYLYNHEDGINDDAVAMYSYIESNDFDMQEGDELMLTKRIIPDVGFNGSTATAPSVTMQIKTRNFPGSAYGTNPANSKPVIEATVGQYTEQVFIRARARQMAFKISSENLGVQWQLGAPRLDARKDGRR